MGGVFGGGTSLHGVLGGMSVSQIWFALPAWKTRLSRSSWAGGPGFLPFLPRFFPKEDHHWLSEQIRQTVRSAGPNPASRTSSTMNRYPNWGSWS